MIKVDMYENHCRIWFEYLSEEVKHNIIKMIEYCGLDYDLHNKSITVYSPTYGLLYELNCIDYVILL